MSDSPTAEITSTVELPPEVVDEITATVSDDVDAETIRDCCFDHLDRRTRFVTPGGQPIETAVRQR
jgi:hypothetical protein